MEGAPDLNPEAEIIRNPEGEPVTYEEILADAKKLKNQGADPFEYPDHTESKNPLVVATWDKIDRWKQERGLIIRKESVATVERTTDMVRACTVWVEAGYTDKEYIEDALEQLRSEQIDAERTDAIPEIQQILADAIEKLESMLGPKSPEEKIIKEIEDAEQLAEQEIADGKFARAVGTYYSTLNTYKKFFEKNKKKENVVEVKKRIEDKMANAKEKMFAQRAEKNKTI